MRVRLSFGHTYRKRSIAVFNFVWRATALAKPNKNRPEANKRRLIALVSVFSELKVSLGAFGGAAARLCMYRCLFYSLFTSTHNGRMPLSKAAAKKSGKDAK